MSKTEFSQLLDWLENNLTPDEAQTVINHLTTAVSPNDDLAWLQNFQQISQTLTLPPLPDDVRHNLQRKFRQHTAGQKKPSLWQRLVAGLTFDSADQPALAGVRGGAAVNRQLIYTTTIADVTLNIQPSAQNNRLDILGQIFPHDETADTADPTPFSVQLFQAKNKVALTVTDDLGEFTFPQQKPGAYTLIVSGGQGDILIPTFTASQKG